jgi:glycerol-3-phosphate dehydrogenase
VVVNAAGPFAEALYVRHGLRDARRVPLSRDMAIVIRRPLVRGQAVAVQTEYRDPDAFLSRGPRHLFIVPWRDVTLAGVNSALFESDPFELATTEAEVEAFVREIDHAVPEWRLTRADVSLVYAGLLPIGSGALSHGNVSFGKRPYLVDNAATDGIEGLVTAVANRFTIARGLAQQAVNMVFRKLGTGAPPCRTAVTPLPGGEFGSVDTLVREARGRADQLVTEGQRERLARTYGATWPEVAQLAADPRLRETVGDTPLLKAEVTYAVRHEMACTLADCVFTRTELGTAGHPGEAALAACADVAAAESGWSAERTRAELADVRARFAAAGAG